MGRMAGVIHSPKFRSELTRIIGILGSVHRIGHDDRSEIGMATSNNVWHASVGLTAVTSDARSCVHIRHYASIQL